VPIPWTTDVPGCGFSPTGRSWLPMPPDWPDASVELQAADPVSTLSMVRSALRHRRAEPALGDGPMAWVDHDDPDVLVVRRPGAWPSRDILVAMNLGAREAVIPGTSLILGSRQDVRDGGTGTILPPDAAAWLRG
jgi:alpha-glucosidase